MAIRWNDSLHPDHADGGANRAPDLPHLDAFVGHQSEVVR